MCCWPAWCLVPTLQCLDAAKGIYLPLLSDSAPHGVLDEKQHAGALLRLVVGYGAKVFQIKGFKAAVSRTAWLAPSRRALGGPADSSWRCTPLAACENHQAHTNCHSGQLHIAKAVVMS